MSWTEIVVGIGIALVILVVAIAASILPSRSKAARKQSFDAPDRGYEPPRDDGGGHSV